MMISGFIATPSRTQELSGYFTLRILLCHVDVDDNEKPLLEINKMAVLNDFTCILTWSLQVNSYEKPHKNVDVMFVLWRRRNIQHDYEDTQL